MTATDAELVSAAKAGDRDAFTALYHRHCPAVTGYLRRAVGDPHLAEDLAQDAFVTALRGLRTLRRPERFRPWLFTIAHRAAADHRAGPVPLGELPEPPTPAEPTHDAAAARESARLVWSAAAGLEPRQRAILDLTVRGGLSTAELADALAVRPAHAAVLAHRARAALGNAVRLLLLARDPRRCPRLAELAPGRPAALTLAQRVSVDRHVRRCPHCRGVATTITAPLAVLGVLLAVKDGGNAPVAAVPVSHAAKLGAVGVVVAVVAVLLLLPAHEASVATPALSPVPRPTTSTPPPRTSTPVTTPVTTPITTTVRPAPAPRPAPTEQDRLIAEVNRGRAAQGCAPLRASSALTSAAEAHAADMMRREYIALRAPGGPSLAERVSAPAPAFRAAFVAAYRETGVEVAAELGALPLDCSLTAIGVGRAVGGECGYYWAVIVGG